MSAKLLFMDGREGEVEVTAGGIIIGRSKECGVITEDPLASRKNTRVSFHGEHWQVEDLGSSNGTFVNELRVQRQLLAHDDVIRCGGLRLRFVTLEDRVAPPAPKPETIVVAPPPPAPEPDELLTRENAQLRARIVELERSQQHLQDEVRAVTDLSQELSAAEQALRAERATLTTRLSELEEELQASNRQLERAHEDVERHKLESDDMRSQLAAAKKTADDGWAQLKTSTADMDKLRRVMGQQEQLLDQRRMGLSALESAVQELRAERDKLVRAQLSLVNERDELRQKVDRQQLAYTNTVEMRGLGS